MNNFWRKLFRSIGHSMGPDPTHNPPYKTDYLDQAPRIVETSNAASAAGPPPGPPVEKKGDTRQWSSHGPGVDEPN
jgi:hypothetical protein